jgi:hypothetical protein
MVITSVHLPSVGEEGYALEISIYRFSVKVTCLISAIAAKDGQLGDFVTGRLLSPVNSDVVKLPIPQIRMIDFVTLVWTRDDATVCELLK